MVNNNKILTVSYGTFSCTLEGFDDSFSTMKAIAEYFRDLASDDRYFGAEPPQLDAEMLARIAQRQISSPVAAYEGESGIVLRAGEADAVGEVETPAADPVDVAEVSEPVSEEAVEKIETEVAPVPDMPANDVVEDVTEEAPAPSVADEIEPVVTVQDAVPMQDYVEPEIANESDVVPAADSIAAKLQRIRAVVSRNEASSHGVDFAEDENADSFFGAPAHPQDAGPQDGDIEDEELVETDASLDDDMTEEPVVAETDDAALELTRVMLAEDGVEDEADEIEDIQDDETQVEDSQHDVAETEVSDADEDDISKALAAYDAAEAGALADDEDENEGESVNDIAPADDDIFGEDENDDIDEDDDLANLLADVRDTGKAAQIPAQARVVKIKRTEFDAAIASGQIETIDENDALDEGTLSDEDEAELLRELAEVAAETDMEPDAAADDDAEFDAADDKIIDDPLEADFAYDDEEEEESDFASGLPTAAVGGEDDLSRLMDTADTKMEEPETSSRREAYSHLRAAVAVANAEHAAGGSVGTDTDDGAYREDLASVVRPRRPEAISDATQSERPSRPVAGKPAPLKLVAEQRVDDQAEHTPRGPVRPRRVSAVQVEDTGAEAGTKGGFVRFAQDMDASGLPDLLEAAAAYMSFVEGREQFSRPQLMTTVRQIETSDFNREDGLRSFGKLLRDGKIQKTSGGRFTASEDIGFRPDERAAG